MTVSEPSADQSLLPEPRQIPQQRKRRVEFPGAVTTLAIVTILVWAAALVIPAGTYQTGPDGALIPGTYHRVPSPLSFADKLQQLILSPVNGLYGLRNPTTGFVDTQTAGSMFGSVGVVLFIMSIGAFISVSFATRSLEVAIAGVAAKLQTRGWLLIAAIMTLLSLLGTTMGFSVETLGFYALFIPLMSALGYDRLVTAAMIIIGALTGVMAATVNPFSIGVAAGESGVSIGDGILLRVGLWVLLTAISVAYVLRYAATVRRDPSRSLVGFEQPAEPMSGSTTADLPHTLSATHKWVLVITAAAFALMIFSVIPWSSIFRASTGGAEDYYTHQTHTPPYWFELNWWFPQLAMLFVLASVIVGVVARMGEKETVRLICQGAADMIGPAIVIMLAAGVSAIMTNTQTLDTILNSMEHLTSGAPASVFAVLTMAVNIPLAILIPSSSGHATLAMPLLSPLADFAGVSRPLTITAWISGHGLALMFAPTSVVLVGGLAIAKVGYDKYLRFAWPLLLTLFATAATVLALAANLE